MTDNNGMPRVKRRHSPGAFTHVIARFVDGQHVMDDVDGARDQYLLRLDRALRRSDWTLCFYALMGTHVHLGVIAGEQPLESWARPLHSGWANWINAAGRRRGGRCRGPVLADRPATLLVPNPRVAVLGAYVHNNPVRAGVAATPEDCSWTSHRAYLGTQPSIPSLDIARGLTFYGCTPSREGRARFHEFVYERRRDPRNPELSGTTMLEVRRRSRQVHGSVAELMTPVVTEAEASFPVHVCGLEPWAPFTRSAEEFLHVIAPLFGTEVSSLRGPGRAPVRARRRRAIVLAWRMLGRRSKEMCASLEVSQPAAANMLRRADEHDLREAERVLARLQGAAL